jgi:hypothetical protein
VTSASCQFPSTALPVGTRIGLNPRQFLLLIGVSLAFSDTSDQPTARSPDLMEARQGDVGDSVELRLNSVETGLNWMVILIDFFPCHYAKSCVFISPNGKITRSNRYFCALPPYPPVSSHFNPLQSKSTQDCIFQNYASLGLNNEPQVPASRGFGSGSADGRLVFKEKTSTLGAWAPWSLPSTKYQLPTTNYPSVHYRYRSVKQGRSHFDSFNPGAPPIANRPDACYRQDDKSFWVPCIFHGIRFAHSSVAQWQSIRLLTGGL